MVVYIIRRQADGIRTHDGAAQETADPAVDCERITGKPEGIEDSFPARGEGSTLRCDYSTVTDLARFRGWSTSHPRRTAM